MGTAGGLHPKGYFTGAPPTNYPARPDEDQRISADESSQRVCLDDGGSCLGSTTILVHICRTLTGRPPPQFFTRAIKRW